jgi:hypothetical protein
MATRSEKLAGLATSPTTGEFHVEPLPKLAELGETYGFKRGQQMFDESLERWRVNLEKSLNKIIRELSSGDSG